MNFPRIKRWLVVALLGLFSFAGATATAIPTAQADYHEHRGYGREVRVGPGYHHGYGYGYRRDVRVYGGGPRVIVAPPHVYYRRHREYRYGHRHGAYYRY